MIIRLTDAQRQTCYAWGPPAAEPWLGRAERVGKTMWDVSMPPIGWRVTLERLTTEAFNAYGQRRGRKTGATHRAVKRISASLAHLEVHPAYHRSALPGEHDTILTGWPLGTWYAPYPSVDDDEGSAISLVPAWSTVGGLRVTTWFGYVPSGWARPDLDPGEHLKFIET
jgi:hypothetical protein